MSQPRKLGKPTRERRAQTSAAWIRHSDGGSRLPGPLFSSSFPFFFLLFFFWLTRFSRMGLKYGVFRKKGKKGSTTCPFIHCIPVNNSSVANQSPSLYNFHSHLRPVFAVCSRFRICIDPQTGLVMDLYFNSRPTILIRPK